MRISWVGLCPVAAMLGHCEDCAGVGLGVGDRNRKEGEPAEGAPECHPESQNPARLSPPGLLWLWTLWWLSLPFLVSFLHNR